MSGLRKIAGNTLISLFGQIVTWASTLGLTIAYGRFLNDLQFGELYLAITLVSLIGFPVEFGFNQQLTRDVAEKPEKARSYLWNTLLIKTLLWSVAYVAILLVCWGLKYSQEQWTIVAICGLTLLSGSIVNAFAALHYAFERTVFPSVGMMLEKGLSALVGFFLLKNGASVEIMAFVLLGGSVVDGLWVGFWFFRMVGKRPAFDLKILIQLVRTSIPFVVYGVLGVIYYRLDTILLSLMANTAVVAWYGAGYRLFDTLLFIPNLILNAVMYPIFSKLASTSKPALKTAVEKCMNLLLICSFPIAAFMIAGAPAIIGFLYHSTDYLNSIPVLQALAPGLIFLYVNTLFSSIIVSTRGEKKIPLLAAAALVFNLGLNLFLIPRFEQTAAAGVTSLTELLLLAMSAVFVPKDLRPGKSLLVAIKTLTASLLMGAVIFYLQRLSVFLLLPLGILIYISLTTLLRTIPREDMHALLKAVKGKGERSSAETLTSIVEENIYTQITDPRLPAVKVKRAMAEARIDYNLRLEATIPTMPLQSIEPVKTHLLPSLTEITTLPLSSVTLPKPQPGPQPVTLPKTQPGPQPVTLPKTQPGTQPVTLPKTQPGSQLEEENMDEDEDITLRLPRVKGKKNERKTTLQLEGS